MVVYPPVFLAVVAVAFGITVDGVGGAAFGVFVDVIDVAQFGWDGAAAS